MWRRTVTMVGNRIGVGGPLFGHEIGKSEGREAAHEARASEYEHRQSGQEEATHRERRDIVEENVSAEPSAKTSMVLRAAAAAMAVWMGTPLGVPVVPEVMRMASTSVSANWAGLACRSISPCFSRPRPGAMAATCICAAKGIFARPGWRMECTRATRGIQANKAIR